MPPELWAALDAARSKGFLGEAPLEAQLAHALGFASAAEELSGAVPAGFVDLGSGGGMPGLVLAWHWPASRSVLLDSSRRRAAALQAALDALGWTDRVRVLCGRAEDAGRDPDLRASQALVVARSFGPPAVTAECAAPLLEVGGLLVVSEPPEDGAAGAGRWPEGPLGQLGLRPLRLWRGEYGYQVLRQEQLCPPRYPRRAGIPAKRPLYR